MTSDKLPVPEGTVLQEKYLVGRLLGRGGMGVVMAARHLLLDTDVALKFLITTEREAAERFSREARAAARLQSEHVARVLDVGALADGSPFMVMEYLAGEDLAQVLERGPIGVVDTVDYVLQACEAIAEAHALGIIHRDLKPANLFLAQRAHGRSMVKVLDFGISRGGGRMPTLTGTAVLGSPHYMSPEQWMETRAADARSDVWSLGVVLHEMLSGRRPFDGDSFPAIFTAIAHGPLPPLPVTVPLALAEAVARCLEKDPGSRFPDVPSLAAAIGGFGSAASRPILDRIAHAGDFKRASTATTAPADLAAGGGAPRSGGVGAESRRADAAVDAMSVEVGGTAVLPGEWQQQPRTATRVLMDSAEAPPAKAPARSGRLPSREISERAPPERARTRPGRSPDEDEPERAPGKTAGKTLGKTPGKTLGKAPSKTPESSGRLPAKVASIVLGAAGALAVVVVVVARLTAGHHPPPTPAETNPPAGVTAPAAPPAPVAPALAPQPTAGTAASPAGTRPAVEAPEPRPSAAVPVAPRPSVAAPVEPRPSAAVPVEPRPSAAVPVAPRPVEPPPAARAPGSTLAGSPAAPSPAARNPSPMSASHAAAPSDDAASPAASPGKTRPKASSRAPAAGAAKAGGRWSAVCSRLLERQSIGETLSKEDLALYMRECRR